jgi:hypothetical protein
MGYTQTEKDEKVQRRIFGPKSEEVTGWRKLHSLELHNFLLHNILLG